MASLNERLEDPEEKKKPASPIGQGSGPKESSPAGKEAPASNAPLGSSDKKPLQLQSGESRPAPAQEVEEPQSNMEDTPFSVTEHVLMAFLSCTLAFMIVFLFMFTRHPDPDPRPVPMFSAAAMSVFIPPVTVIAVSFGVFLYKMSVGKRLEENKASKFWWDMTGIFVGFGAVMLLYLYRQRVFLNASKTPEAKKSYGGDSKIPFSVAFNLSCYFLIALVAMVLAKVTNRLFLCENMDEPYKPIRRDFRFLRQQER